MRFAAAILAATLVALPAPAFAYENFIPQGHAYSPDDPEMPEFNSAQDQLNGQVDIFQADIWTRQRAAKSFSSNLDQFSGNQELKGGSDFIDY